MDQYRKIIGKRMLFGRIITLLFVIIYALDAGGFFKSLTGQSQHTFISSFQMGLLVGLITVAVLNMFKMRRALKNDEALKVLYNEEHDERLRFIRQKVGMPLIGVTSSILIVVGIFAGYVNPIMFYTLVAAGVFQLCVSVGLKVYYMKTM